MSYINEEIPHTRRIETPPDVAEGVNGEPAFVIMRTRASNKTFRVLSKLGQVNGELSAMLVEIQRLDNELAANEHAKLRKTLERKINEASQLRAQADSLVDQVYEVYIYFLVDWNWLSVETGEPLAKPDDRQVFEDELSPQQIFWIRQQVEATKTYWATEGNG